MHDVKLRVFGQVRSGLLLIGLYLFVFAGCASRLDGVIASSGIAGVGHELLVPVPVSESNIVAGYKNQTGKSFDGAKVNKYARKDNPVIGVLSGMDSIWTAGNEAWSNGGADGNGLADYSGERIVNPSVWTHNIAYVVDVTSPAKRTSALALEAYLDDRRDQNYSVMDGLGPLLPRYLEGSRAFSTVMHSGSDGFDPNAVITYAEDDKGNGAGDKDSSLGAFISFLGIIRGPEGTTSPAKYFYASPRPWRMNDTGEVIQTGTDTVGDKTVEAYQTRVSVLPALMYVRETRGRVKDGGFPSGHTNAAYLSAFAFAYTVPERFSAMITRASELGENRIRSGMHSPLDVMGGRIMSTALAAAYLGDKSNEQAKKNARDVMKTWLTASVPQGSTLTEFANSGADRWNDGKKNREVYRARMTYGFAKDPTKAGKKPVVPAGAEVLLETRFPYLSADQRRAILYTTSIDSGYPLLDESEGWGRLDLVTAAAGYGSFEGDVHVSMSAANGDFAAFDSWDNSITGPGALFKTGDGALRLTGVNQYTGGTSLAEGTLVAANENAFGSGPLEITGGTLVVAVAYAPEGLKLASGMAISGGVLDIALPVDTQSGGKEYKAISGKTIKGRFAKVSINSKPCTVKYTKDSIIVKLP